MTGFAIGLSAAALWVVVLVGVLLLARSSSGPPQRSIQRFKSDRQAIKTARAAAISDTPASDPAPDAARSGPQIEVEAAQLVQLNWDGLLITQNVDASEEVQEIEALVGSVTDSLSLIHISEPTRPY